MITIKNIQTGEIKKVFNTEFVNSYVRNNEGKTFGKRFVNSWAGILTETTDEDGQQVFTLSADWEVVTGKGERKQRQTKAKKDEQKAEPQPTKDEQQAVVEVIAEPVAKEEQRAQVEDTKDDEQALIAAIKNLRGGQVDDAKVRSIFAEELAKLSEPQRAQVSRIATKVAKKEGQVYHENFEDVKKRIARGQWDSFQDFADNMADEEICCHSLGQSTEFFERYFDYEAYARDLECDYYVSDNGYVFSAC